MAVKEKNLTAWAVEIGIDLEVWTADGLVLLAREPVYVFQYPEKAHRLVRVREIMTHFGPSIAGGAIVRTVSVIQTIGEET